MPPRPGLTPSPLDAAAARFVGREGTLERLAEAFARERLVELVGPPGVGKTRLAVTRVEAVAGGGFDPEADRALAGASRGPELTPAAAFQQRCPARARSAPVTRRARRTPRARVRKGMSASPSTRCRTSECAGRRGRARSARRAASRTSPRAARVAVCARGCRPSASRPARSSRRTPTAPKAACVTSPTCAGYGGSCELYIVVPSKTFTYDVPGPGRLSLTLTSDVNLDLLALGDCADPNGSELACQSGNGSSEVLDLDFAETPAGPVMIVVRGKAIPDVGAFTLHATFTPAVCGDGVAVGPEVCDDGNTAQGDGFCSADCLSPDWPAICESAPTLSTSAPNAGDTAGAPNLNHTDGYCTFATGGEVTYRYEAPKDGTLVLHLDETSANYAVYVLDGCGAATEDTLLACGNAGWPPSSSEHLEVPLVAGQAITVVVDTAVPSAGGPFSLGATFQ